MVPLAALAAAMLPFGLSSGFLQWPTLNKGAARLLGLGITTLVAPGILEEAIFRVALLSIPVAPAEAMLAWLAFVVYHLDTIHPPLHSDPRFLATAGALGMACTVAYYTSGGSMWAAVLVHWFPVWAWLGLLGGLEAHERGHFGSRAQDTSA